MDTSPYCGHLSMHTMDTFPLWMQYAYYGHLSMHTMDVPFRYECNMHTMDTSPYCGHLSIMNAICILWTPLHPVDTSPCILWTPFHYECKMHTMDTSPYCGHLSIMNAICILWIPLHTVDTSLLWMQYAYYGHYECNMHTMDTSPSCGHLSMHTMDTFPLWMHYAYYGYVSILWTPLHYECNMHTMDTSPYCGHLSTMNAICILWILLHTVDTSPLWTDTSAFFISHTMDTFSYKSLLHTPLHKLWTPLHTKETYAQCGPLRILQTPLHTAVYTYAYMYHGHLCII